MPGERPSRPSARDTATDLCAFGVLAAFVVGVVLSIGGTWYATHDGGPAATVAVAIGFVLTWAGVIGARALDGGR